MDVLRVGLIGTSWWADLFYLPVLSAYDRVDLCAICGRNPERAAEMAAKYNISQVYGDYQRMIAEAELDAIVVATPDDMHHKMVMAALDAGLHVLCEKPIALNAVEARQMAEKAMTADLKTMVLFTWRWMPQFQYTRLLLEQGYIGRPYHADFYYLSGYARSEDYLWRLDAERANGILGDLGSHIIDLARYYIGEVRSVSALLGSYQPRQGASGGRLEQAANDAGALLLEFDNDAQATLRFSAVAQVGNHGDEIGFRLYGEKGTLSSQLNLFAPQYQVWGDQDADADVS
jgi:predicted dehydrogenase